jgi:hypothetical protein
MARMAESEKIMKYHDQIVNFVYANTTPTGLHSVTWKLRPRVSVYGSRERTQRAVAEVINQFPSATSSPGFFTKRYLRRIFQRTIWLTATREDHLRLVDLVIDLQRGKINVDAGSQGA